MLDQVNKNVLIIDDQPEFCDVVATVLEDSGFQVAVASGKERFLELAPRHWDCILVDLMMPEFDGIETVRHLSGIGSKAPLIIMSGYSATLLDSAKALAELCGMTVAGSCQKPIDIFHLVSIVEVAVSANDAEDDTDPASMELQSGMYSGLHGLSLETTDGASAQRSEVDDPVTGALPSERHTAIEDQ